MESRNKNPEQRGIKVLVVEDDEVTTQYMSIILRDYVSVMDFVASGSEAIEIIRKNPDYQLILMDIRVQGTDGIEATRQIRKFNRDVVIIAQTAYTLNVDRAEALEAGCNDYLVKPVQKEILTGIIGKYFNIDQS